MQTSQKSENLKLFDPETFFAGFQGEIPEEFRAHMTARLVSIAETFATQPPATQDTMGSDDGNESHLKGSNESHLGDTGDDAPEEEMQDDNASSGKKTTTPIVR